MSAWVRGFTDRLDYRGQDEITVEVFLSGKPLMPIAVTAKIDTGSKFCIVQPRYAIVLGLDLETGIRERIRTAAGSFTAYGHEIILTINDMEWEATVYFAEPENFPVNVVGRTGFLDHLQVGLVAYDSCLTSARMALPDCTFSAKILGSSTTM